MSETTEKTRIQMITETEGVKYEIYIPRTNQPSILIYLDEESFFSFLNGLAEYGVELKRQEKQNV
ncbi:hypothetical protein LEP1GSC186_2056 [Leptospira noguchii serovar Autumnalis str. ZUN142]|uniref:Uncharacterized protein n=1 Tax=Leptospira noguchii serovar Autumnalis str. ZUN142 TaxID=1085540 RepID=M6UKZ7_9LEPT|nr:hypothetical protein [Leptospira noguchii]EMO41754.1 hypothetical protein LEP1GSC186_2056 [Leptospira noguchii serovar Autumnalis str. ZUN142]